MKKFKGKAGGGHWGVFVQRNVGCQWKEETSEERVREYMGARLEGRLGVV